MDKEYSFDKQQCKTENNVAVVRNGQHMYSSVDPVGITGDYEYNHGHTLIPVAVQKVQIENNQTRLLKSNTKG